MKILMYGDRKRYCCELKRYVNYSDFSHSDFKVVQMPQGIDVTEKIRHNMAVHYFKKHLAKLSAKDLKKELEFWIKKSKL